MSYAAAAAAAGAAIGSLTVGTAKDKKSYKYSKKLMDYQNQLNIQNWNLQNEYNKPSAQMARYAEAGLNPNLIYGQENTAGSISEPSGSFQSQLPDVNPVASYLSYKAMDAEIKNKHEQNSLLQSQADYVKEQALGVALENDLKRKTLLSVGSGNPNDPYWYRDLKKNIGPVQRGAGVVGRFVGNTVGGVARATRPMTVRYNGKEYEVFGADEAERFLEQRLPRKGRVQWSRKDKGGR